MALVFLYLFVAPLIGGDFENYIFPIAFIGSGILLYFPFVFFKLSIPGVGKLISTHDFNASTHLYSRNKNAK